MSERGFNHRDGVLIRVLLLRSGVFKHSSGSHPGANAHGHDAVRPAARKTQERNSESRRRQQTMSVCGSRDEPLPSASELVEQRHHLSSSGAAQRVTQSDGSSVRIHLLQRDAQLLHTVHGLSSSRGSVQPVTEQEEKKHFYLKQKAKFTWCQKISLFSCLSVTFEPVWSRTEPFYGSLCNIE